MQTGDSRSHTGRRVPLLSGLTSYSLRLTIYQSVTVRYLQCSDYYLSRTVTHARLDYIAGETYLRADKHVFGCCTNYKATLARERANDIVNANY